MMCIWILWNWIYLYCVYNLYIYIMLWRKGPYCTGGVRRRCYINISEGRDRYGTGGEGRRGIYHISERDLYCTGGVRRRCYDIHIFATLQMIENEWLCVMCVCVWDTRGMLDVLLYMVMETSDTGYMYTYQYQLNNSWK